MDDNHPDTQTIRLHFRLRVSGYVDVQMPQAELHAHAEQLSSGIASAAKKLPLEGVKHPKVRLVRSEKFLKDTKAWVTIDVDGTTAPGDSAVDDE